MANAGQFKRPTSRETAVCYDNGPSAGLKEARVGKTNKGPSPFKAVRVDSALSLGVATGFGDSTMPGPNLMSSISFHCPPAIAALGPGSLIMEAIPCLRFFPLRFISPLYTPLSLHMRCARATRWRVAWTTCHERRQSPR